MEQEKTCIVICAGDLTVSEITVGEEDLVIAVDGGFDYCRFLEISPDVILGDFDSLSEGSKAELQKTKAEILTLPPEKDDTDTLAALRLGLQRGYRRFCLYGATGGRLDHTLANIQCLLFLKEQGASGYLCDASSLIFAMQNEEVAFQKSMEGTLSLFAMDRMARGVNISGMKYPLRDAEVRNSFPIGISNEFIGEAASVSVAEGSLIVMIRY